MPTLKPGEKISDLNLSEEEKLFLGMMAGVSGSRPRNTVSYYAVTRNDRQNQLKKIAENLCKIRHWDIRLGSYEDLKNEVATWFVDPPYQFGGNGYVHHKIDYNALADWCKSRKGQVIVGENMKADWMKFKPMVNFRGAMSTVVEAIWSTLPTAFDNEQLSMFNKEPIA